jgi:hypothetical protein
MQGDVANALRLLDESLRICQKIGALRELLYKLLGVALCVTIAADIELSTTLHGAADGLMEEMGQSFEPLEDTLRERDHFHLRQTMGEAAFEAAYAAGRRLISSEAIELSEQAIQRLLATPAPI